MSHPYRQSTAAPERRRRRVPLALRLHILFGNAGVWFGVVWAGVLSLGLISAFDQIEPRRGYAYDRVARAEIVRVEKLASGRKNKQHLVVAAYTAEDGVPREARSYTDEAPEVGRAVEVKYERAHPERAVIAGQRTHRYNTLYPVVIAAFGAVGALLVFWPSKSARLALRLLPRGAVASGKVLEVTDDGGGHTESWTTRLEFTSRDRRTHQCAITTGEKPPYEVGATWPVVYDEGWPDHATPLAHLGGAPAITDDDRVTHGGRAAVYYGIVAATVVNGFLFVGCLVTVVLALW